MGKELTITVQGKDTRVTVQSLIEMLERTLGVLRELDVRMSDNQQAEGMQWGVGGVSMNSPLTMTFEAKIPTNRRDNSADVVREFLRGLATFEKSATVPEHFSDDALRKTRELVNLLNNGVARLEFSSPGEETVTPTLLSATNIDEVMERLDISSPGEETAPHLSVSNHDEIADKQHAFYYEQTTIEGRLEALNAHGGMQVFIWDALTDKRVKCLVNEEQLKDAIAKFGKRVAITGRAKVERAGKLLWIKVESTIRVLRERSELPQAKDFEGTGRVDITGGVDSAEYIRGMRDAE